MLNLEMFVHTFRCIFLFSGFGSVFFVHSLHTHMFVCVSACVLECVSLCVVHISMSFHFYICVLNA